MKSLIVEDDAVGRTLLTDLLERHGRVVACDNGAEAVQAFTRAFETNDKFDLICMDIMLPEMDGHEALANIRKFEGLHGVSCDAGVKVIMITSLDDSENVLRSYTERCAAYCVKPIDVDDFYGHLSALGLLTD